MAVMIRDKIKENAQPVPRSGRDRPGGVRRRRPSTATGRSSSWLIVMFKNCLPRRRRHRPADRRVRHRPLGDGHAEDAAAQPAAVDADRRPEQGSGGRPSRSGSGCTSTSDSTRTSRRPTRRRPLTRAPGVSGVGEVRAEPVRVELDAGAHRRADRHLAQVAALGRRRLGTLQLVEHGAEVGLELVDSKLTLPSGTCTLP